MHPLYSIAEETGSDDEGLDEADSGSLDDRSVNDDSDIDPSSPPSSRTHHALFTPYTGLAVANFLTDDDGNSIVEKDDTNDKMQDADDVGDGMLRPPTAASSSTLWLSRISSQIFVKSADAIAPITSRLARASRYFSADSVVEHLTTRDGEQSFPLAKFCDLIAKCASLERAKIVSVECYKERSRFGILHRTLIFHLRREGRTDVWMRVDRRRSRDVSLPMFALRGGRTDANDVALLAGSKEELLDRRPAVLENSMQFTSPPNLGVFRFCLQIICEELLEYRIWPENCWFMCSLLQEHLFETGLGAFNFGEHIHLRLAPLIRSRVRNRVYHLVSVFPIVNGSRKEAETNAPSFDVAVRWKTIDGGFDTREFDGPELNRYLEGLFETLRDHYEMTQYGGPRDDTPVPEVAQRALALEYLLLQQHPNSGSSRLADLMLANPEYITHDTTSPFPDCLHALRVLYKLAPIGIWHSLASHLTHLARATSISDPTASRAHAIEARTIVSTPLKGGKCWTHGQVLNGHTNVVRCVAFSPDGKQIASASGDGTVRRWDALTGESIGEPMRGHTDLVRAVAFSPDGTQIVSGSYDTTLRLWDASSGEPIGAPMQGHSSFVLCVAYSPDGKFIVSGSLDGTIRRWDASTGETVDKPLEGHTRSVWSVAFSPEGQRIVSGSEDKTIRLWDAITGKAIGEPWEGHTHTVSSVAFSPDGRFVVSGSWDDTVRRWEALTGESIGVPMKGHTKDVNCVAVSPDGKQIASASDDRTIRIWDVTTGEQIGEPLKGHTGIVWSVAFSPDGRQIVSGSYDKTVRIWDSLENPDRWTESE